MIRKLAITSTVCAALLIGLHPAALANSTRPTVSCGAGLVRARIAGHVQCLHEGQRCRRKLDRAYHRYFFHCHGSYLTFGWNFLHRPFHVSRLAPGSRCPTTHQTGMLDELGIPGIGGPGFGPGPAFPTNLGEGPDPVLGYFYPMDPNVFGTEWGGTKAIWVIAPGYHGQILIRGRQLDGPNEVRFEDGHPGFTRAEDLHPLSELRFEDYGDGHPALTRLRAPGCYAYQVDGLHFSYDVVFEARLLGPEPTG